MEEKPSSDSPGATRASPRAEASLDVDVEVAGEKRKVRLVSKDIGAGGIFLRTDEPAPLWKRVKLSLSMPDGSQFEVTGEVVRCVSPERAQAKGHPAGMAVAFDEVSRHKRKELTALVLDFCSQRPDRKEAAPDPSPPPEPSKAALATPADDVPANKADPAPKVPDMADELLDEIDSLLDSVEDELDASESEDPVEVNDPDGVPLGEAMPDQAEPVIFLEPVPPVPQADSGEFDIDIEDLAPVGEESVAALQAYLDDYLKTREGDTYYHVLGVGLTASPAEIEQAYQDLLGSLKPPGPPDALPPELLRKLSSILGKVRKAFAILSKPDRKRAYDFLIDNEGGLA